MPCVDVVYNHESLAPTNIERVLLPAARGLARTGALRPCLPGDWYYRIISSSSSSSSRSCSAISSSGDSIKVADYAVTSRLGIAVSLSVFASITAALVSWLELCAFYLRRL